MKGDEERGLAMKKTCNAWRMSSPVDFTITKYASQPCIVKRHINRIRSFDSNLANLVNVFLVLKKHDSLQEHVLSYSMYLCFTGIFSICMLTYIYLQYICSSLLIGGTKKSYMHYRK